MHYIFLNVLFLHILCFFQEKNHPTRTLLQVRSVMLISKSIPNQHLIPRKLDKRKLNAVPEGPGTRPRQSSATHEPVSQLHKSLSWSARASERAGYWRARELSNNKNLNHPAARTSVEKKHGTPARGSRTCRGSNQSAPRPATMTPGLHLRCTSRPRLPFNWI